jgi:hypothetical protein
VTAPAVDNTQSVLNSTKKALQLDPDYDAFDPDLIMHINGVFSTLNQLGVGPDEGFMITGDQETWDTFLGTDPKLNQVKTYVYLRVRLLFDPPQTAFLADAYAKQIEQLEWRLNVQAEGAFG